MQALVATQDTIANNLANVNTPGFKSLRAVYRGHYMNIARKVSGRSCTGGGVTLSGVAKNLTVGSIQPTGGPLDVAIDGPGFFVVEGPQDEPLYTRNGRFTLNSNSELVTQTGWRVLDTDGRPIVVTGSNPSIRSDGTVFAGGSEVGRLGLVEFESPHMLELMGMSLYAASPSAGEPTAATESRLAPKALEMSNVNVVGEMIRMMMGLRQYEAAYRAVRIIDESVNLAVNKVPSL